MRSRFICAFREIAPQPWKINIETSLNVPQEHVRRLMEVIDEFVIDIKDMNPQIYKAYTGLDNAQVIENLKSSLTNFFPLGNNFSAVCFNPYPI